MFAAALNRFDLVLAAIADPTHAVRFWLAALNLALFIVIFAWSRVTRDFARFPNAGMCIPMSGLMAGFMGYDAIRLFDFLPFGSWRVFLNIMIASCLALLAVMLLMRWKGYDL